MDGDAAEPSLSPRECLRDKVAAHPLPAGCIHADGNQAAKNHHNDPRGRNTDGRAKRTQKGDADHNKAGSKRRR